MGKPHILTTKHTFFNGKTKKSHDLLVQRCFYKNENGENKVIHLLTNNELDPYFHEELDEPIPVLAVCERAAMQREKLAQTKVKDELLQAELAMQEKDEILDILYNPQNYVVIEKYISDSRRDPYIDTFIQVFGGVAEDQM